jgi:hypothetical protein
VIRGGNDREERLNDQEDYAQSQTAPKYGFVETFLFVDLFLHWLLHGFHTLSRNVIMGKDGIKLMYSHRGMDVKEKWPNRFFTED